MPQDRHVLGVQTVETSARQLTVMIHHDDDDDDDDDACPVGRLVSMLFFANHERMFLPRRLSFEAGFGPIMKLHGGLHTEDPSKGANLLYMQENKKGLHGTWSCRKMRLSRPRAF